VAAAIGVATLSAALIGLELALSEPISVDPSSVSSASAIPSECMDDSPEAIRSRLGERIIVRMEAEATPSLRRQASRGEIGGVILFPPPGADPGSLRSEIARLQRVAGEEALIVAVDQEGGAVTRVAELPPELAPPEIAARGAAAAHEQGLSTARALARLGINVDLAPVLDVPETPSSFLAGRAFGSTPASVAETGGAFAAGLAEGGVAATAKHFPGLGRSAVNTDLQPSEIATAETALRADLEPFERAIDDGIALAMLSNASYPALDPDLPAFASSRIASGLLRDELGFGGVTITDDLDAGAVRASFAREEAARLAVAGGSDLLLFAQTARPDVLDSLVREARRGRLDPMELEESCVRVRTLRGSLAG
jgi:beta-N-acetylhexosaminidase